MAENSSVTPLRRPVVPTDPHQETPKTLQRLHHLMNLIQASPSAQEGLLKVTQALGEFFGSTCWIGLLDPICNITHTVYCNLVSTPAWLPETTELSALLSHINSRQNLDTLEPIALSDLPEIPPDVALTLPHMGWMKVSALEASPRTALVIRTFFNGNTNGVILLTRSQPYSWTESDMQSLKTLSTCVAISISQMQLEQHAQQQIHYQALLDQLAIASRSDRSLDRIFQLALEGAVNILQASRGFVMLLKYSEPILKARSLEAAAKLKSPAAKVMIECQYPLTCDLAASTIIPQQEPLDHSCGGTWLKAAFPINAHDMSQCMLVNGKTTVIVPATHTNPADHPSTSETKPFNIDDSGLISMLNMEAMPSLLLMPLESQGMVLGCLILQCEQQRVWQPQEIGFVRLVAAQVSTAMIQTQTLRQVQSLVDERTAQLQKSLDVQAKLYEKTRQQVAQLRRLNQVMEEFVSTVSHELRTPLTSMILAIRMLRQVELSSEQRTRYLDILENQCFQEANLINDLLALQKIETSSSPSQFQLLDVRYLIQSATQSFEALWAKKQLKLELDLPNRSINLQTDSDSLNRILLELLTNAGKYGECDSTIRLKLIHQGDQIKLTLSNVGAGITPEEMPYIFDKFRRGQGVTQQAVPGTGLGLALVKGLVEHLSGAIAVSSVPVGHNALWETCFTLTLPQSPEISLMSLD